MKDSYENSKGNDQAAVHAALIEALPVGVGMASPEGRILSLNQVGLRLHGFESEAEMFHEFSQYLDVFELRYADGVNVPVEEWPMSRAIRGDFVQDYVVRLVNRRQGTEFTVSYSVVPVRDSGGHIVRLGFVIQDLTKIKHAEIALRQSEELYRATFSSAAVGIAHVDLGGRWIRFNDALSTITGYPREELLTKTFADITHPDDVDADLDLFHRVLDGKLSEYQMDKRYIRKDGAIIWVSLHVSVVRDSTGNINHFVSVVTDITSRKVAEEALRENQEQFRTLIDAIPQLVWMAEPDGYIFWYNQRWYDYTGATPEQMAGWGWKKLHDPEMLPLVVRTWQQSIDTGEPFEMVFPLRGKDGLFRQFLTRVVPMRDANGRIVRWFGTNTDVTMQKRAEEEVRSSEQRFRRLAEAMPTLVWMTDAHGKVEYINQRYADYIGMQCEQLVDGGWERTIEPSELDGVRETWLRSLRTGEDYESHFRLRRYDGEYRWFLVRGVPIRSADGRIQRWFGSCTDVHDQRTAADAIRYNEERLRVALTASGTGTFRWDPRTGDFLSFDENLKTLFGRPDEEFRNTSDFVRYIHSEDIPEVVRRIQASHLGADFEMEFRIVLPNGEIRWLYDRAKMELENGRPKYFVGACTDITTRKLSESALIQSEKLASVGRMAATVAHEINNPLEAVTNLLYLIATDASINESAKAYLSLADEELRRVAHLTKQTLGFYRERSAAKTIQPAQVIEDLVQLYSRKLEQKKIRVKLRLNRESTVEAVGGELRQILSNLFTNSLDALPVGGALYVRVSRPTQWKKNSARAIRITVADNGSGINAEVLPRIFEPFFTTKRDFGTGLGLWVTRDIVTKHGGTIRVRSRVGNGTVFTVFLPSAFDASGEMSLADAQDLAQK